tara:strand:- start:268 stop:417 length:150 start_codon:yes stop_codon:yes gene_type:complete
MAQGESLVMEKSLTTKPGDLLDEVEAHKRITSVSRGTESTQTILITTME